MFAKKRRNVFFDIAIFASVPFFGFYTTKLGLSPIYFSFLVAGIFTVLGYVYGEEDLTINSINIVAISLVSYLVILLLLHWEYDAGNMSAWVNIVFSLLYLIVISALINNVKHEKILKAVSLAIRFSVALLFIEFIYRILNPATQFEAGSESRDDLLWYAFKTSSFMYPDSNFVGLFLACLFIFVLQFKKYYEPIILYLMPIGILLIGSLSRASILSTIIVSIFLVIKNRVFRLVILIAGTTAAISLLYFVDINDDSLSERFWIASLILEYVKSSDFLLLLIGGGPGNAEKLIGVGAHLLFFTWLLELGIFGTVMQIALWYLIWRKAPSTTGPLFSIFILNGFAFTTFAIPWFYVMTILMIYFSKEEEIEK